MMCFYESHVFIRDPVVWLCVLDMEEGNVVIKRDVNLVLNVEPTTVCVMEEASVV